MVGDNFSYCNRSLSDFGFVMMKPESEDSTGLTREVLKGETTVNKYEAMHYGVKYSDVLVLNFFIVKDDELYDDNGVLTQRETREIERWLTNSKKPEFLKVQSNENPSIEYYGIFTDISPFVVNGLNGLYLTFTCTSPFAYETNSIIFVNSDENYKRIFNCTSDEDAYIYPIIKIKPSESGTFSIHNTTENKTMSLTLDDDYTEYIIDCKLKRIIADGEILTMNDVGWNISNIIADGTENEEALNDVALGTINLYWLRFKPGNNKLTINGDGEYHISCKSPVKLGGMPYA